MEGSDKTTSAQAGENGAGSQASAPRPPQSSVAHQGSDERPSRHPVQAALPDSDAHPFDFPYNCSFRKEDFVDDPNFDCVYDAVICLSVTKWVHFNHGDPGVKKLFTKFYQCLSPGGKLILEWQEWASYKKKKSLSETFKKNVAAIKIRPDDFSDYLIKEVGFKEVKELEPPGNNAGFQRPLMVFTK
mmetsp:Transcript_2207/g.3548  ORF Transcript_2207/g.3548 Transcript_2207/m.3548 type:complete len:187 (+) Transcript_2207:2-562(+)